MKKMFFLFLLSFLLVSFGAALAADKAPEGKGCGEVKAHKHHIKFDDCDKGQTGALTFEEAHACWPRLDRKTFDAIDTNKDGKITKQELKENRERHAKGNAE